MALRENGPALGLVTGFPAVPGESWDPDIGQLEVQAFSSSPCQACVAWEGAELI